MNLGDFGSAVGAGASTAGEMTANPYLSVAGSFLSSLGSAFSSSSNADKSFKRQLQLQENQQKFNSEQADKQRAYEREMFDLENMYNSPSNQVSLLRQAGINPAVMFGDGSTFKEGSAGAGAAASPASGGSAPMATPASPQSQGEFMAILKKDMFKEQMRKQRLENDLTELNVEDKRNEVEAKKKGRGVDYINDEASVDADGNPVVTKATVSGYDIPILQAVADLNIKHTMNAKEKRELALFNAQYPFLAEMSDYQLRNLKADLEFALKRNRLQEMEVDFADKYGILPSDDGWSSLIKAVMRNDSAVFNAFDAIIQGLVTTGKKSLSALLGLF